MRLHQHELHELLNQFGSDAKPDSSEFWDAVDRTGNRPLLVRLIRALFVLPHRNAEVERIFNHLNDTVTKKRRSLKPLTVKALIVAQSCLRSKGWTAATLPVNQRVVNL